MVHIFRAPPNVAAAREKLFNPTELQVWSPEDYDKFSPYATNFWSHKRSTPLNSAQLGTQISYYYCRLYPKEIIRSPATANSSANTSYHVEIFGSSIYYSKRYGRSTLSAGRFMWEDSGFELYEGITSEYYTKEIDDEIGALYHRRLDMREALDSLKSKYYDLEEAVAELLQGLADNALKRWVARLEYITGPLRNMGIADLEAKLQAE
ncbi:hypothetical protein ABVK25_004341 [Lepraria finkii]|uniref:Uncharacterized protein n=1 Tax=Lepraria finkii TaxID=1340010 RepID=A0ABR4BDL5_9LECA